MNTFIIAVASLSSLCGVLAVLLVIADKYLNDYGECKVTINEGDEELTVEGGQSILSALSKEGIFIPSACGGRGSCGLCKLKVDEGAGPLLPTEGPHLSDEEKKDNVRLCCQVKIREDIKMRIPEELFAIKEYKGKVEKMEQLTWDIKRVRIKLIDPDAIDFTPGQYIQLQAPKYGKNPEPVYRAYSLASDYQEKGVVECIIRLVPDGICTTWVFELLEEGEEVTLNGPYGDFHLSDTDREMIFIAGGSGMAPFCSILDQMIHENIDRKATYFFGARSLRDLFYTDLMKDKYEKELPNFTYLPALSEPLPEDNWEGETGLITDVVGSHYEDCSDMEAYLCGSPGMIDACIKVLTSKGMPEEQIYYDKFA